MRRTLPLAVLLAAALAAGVWAIRRDGVRPAPSGAPAPVSPASRATAGAGKGVEPTIDTRARTDTEPTRSESRQADLLRRYHDAKDPAARAAALAAFRAAEPDNALGPYLAASEAARAGNPIAAAAAMVDARLGGSMRKDDWGAVLEADAALRAEGKPDAEAFAEAVGAWLDTRTTGELFELGRGLGELQRVFVGLGEWDEADFLLEGALELGADLRASGTLLDNLAGAAVERALLEPLDPETVIGWDGERASERLEALEAETAELRALAAEADARVRELDAAGWAEYRRRLAEEGERAALRWARDRR